MTGPEDLTPDEAVDAIASLVAVAAEGTLKVVVGLLGDALGHAPASVVVIVQEGDHVGYGIAAGGDEPDDATARKVTAVLIDVAQRMAREGGGELVVMKGLEGSDPGAGVRGQG